jgi:hypothetical protein
LKPYPFISLNLRRPRRAVDLRITAREVAVVQHHRRGYQHAIAGVVIGETGAEQGGTISFHPSNVEDSKIKNPERVQITGVRVV